MPSLPWRLPCLSYEQCLYPTMMSPVITDSARVIDRDVVFSGNSRRYRYITSRFVCRYAILQRSQVRHALACEPYLDRASTNTRQTKSPPADITGDKSRFRFPVGVVVAYYFLFGENSSLSLSLQHNATVEFVLRARHTVEASIVFSGVCPCVCLSVGRSVQMLKNYRSVIDVTWQQYILW